MPPASNGTETVRFTTGTWKGIAGMAVAITGLNVAGLLSIGVGIRDNARDGLRLATANAEAIREMTRAHNDSIKRLEEHWDAQIKDLTKAVQDLTKAVWEVRSRGGVLPITPDPPR